MHAILDATGSIEITWFRLPPGNPLVGKSLAETNLRVLTGASVVAILRAHELMANSKSSTIFEALDQIGFIGDPEQIEAVENLFSEVDI